MTDTNSKDSAPPAIRGTTRERLIDAMIRVVGSQGLQSASVRTIAREAGCNEAVLYQHFPGKIAMQQAIFSEIMSEMATEKKALAERMTDTRELIDGWVMATYEFYDRKPFAFAYVYLSYPPIGPEDAAVPGPNTKIFSETMNRLPAPNGWTTEFNETTFSLFKAAILAIPRAIHSGLIDGRAMDYYESSRGPLSRILLVEA